MRTVNIQITVPEDMSRYSNNVDYEQIFERDAMLLYPFIRNLTISHEGLLRFWACIKQT